MKKVVSFLLSFVLCLCLLDAPIGSSVNRTSNPVVPETGTAESVDSNDLFQLMDDDVPGDWGSNI